MKNSLVKKSYLNTFFLITIILLVGYATYLVFKPFLIAIFLAFVISQLFKNWFVKLNKLFKNHPSLASLALCFILFCILVIPFLLVIGLIANEATNLYHRLQSVDLESLLNQFLNLPLINNLGLNLDMASIQELALLNSDRLAESTQNLGNFLFIAVKGIYQGTSQFFFITFVTLFILYYFFKDGDKIIKKIMEISPLKKEDEIKILLNFNSISKATLKGSLVIAIIQGVLLGLMFWITGVPSPTLWGVVTAILSLIPLLGAVLVWLPAGIVMLFLGSIWQAVVILLFGGIVISSIDNILRPKLVGNETSLHPILVFLATLGGIALFGLIGFLLGPVIVVLFISLLDIYQIKFKEELRAMN